MVNHRLARRRRRELELSQEEVAKRAGVNRRTITMWESGDQIPGADKLTAWATAIDLPVAELLDGEPTAEVAAS